MVAVIVMVVGTVDGAMVDVVAIAVMVRAIATVPVVAVADILRGCRSAKCENAQTGGDEQRFGKSTHNDLPGVMPTPECASTRRKTMPEL